MSFGMGGGGPSASFGSSGTTIPDGVTCSPSTLLIAVSGFPSGITSLPF